MDPLDFMDPLNFMDITLRGSMVHAKRGPLLSPKSSWKRFGLLALMVFPCFATPAPQQPQSSNAQTTPARFLGTVKSISGTTITLSSDVGSDVTVLVLEAARLLRVEPGQKDLKDAASLQLQDIQPGDRLLVRGKMAPDGKSFLAAQVIAMKKMDIAQKQAHEREEC